jgi:hypothetical protein
MSPYFSGKPRRFMRSTKPQVTTSTRSRAKSQPSALRLCTSALRQDVKAPSQTAANRYWRPNPKLFVCNRVIDSLSIAITSMLLSGEQCASPRADDGVLDDGVLMEARVGFGGAPSVESNAQACSCRGAGVRAC